MAVDPITPHTDRKDRHVFVSSLPASHFDWGAVRELNLSYYNVYIYI